LFAVTTPWCIEFDEQVFGRRDDTLEVVFGQHKHALVQLDGHLFLGIGVGDRRVNQQERCERYVKDHVVDSIRRAELDV
jgi:hypothetical protein